MQNGRAQIPAVVVGGAGACGLGVIRSLSQANVPTILVDDNPHAPAMHSRFGRKVVISKLSGPSLIRDLLALSAGIPDRPVLFLTSDEATQTVSEHRAQLASAYRFTLPGHECLGALMHKTRFQELAEALGFPVPRSLTIASTADLGRLERLQFPAIIKPTIKTADYLSRHFARAYKVFSPEEAEARCREMLTAVPGLVVQEWIEGPDTEIYFSLLYRAVDGSTVCCFTGRKLSIWPPDVGVTASCTAAPEVHHILEPLTRSFFERVSFVGMGGIEFKKDIRTGQFLMVEPTAGRVDAQEEVATIHGVNIPLMVYLYEAELPPAARPMTLTPIVWRDTWAHIRSTRHNPTLRVNIQGCKVFDAYWRINDPLPALVHSLGGSVRSLRKALRPHSVHNPCVRPFG